MKGLPFVLFFTAMTFVAWGAYGPVLHHGALALEHDSLRAFVGVGLAYFLIGVIIPMIILQRGKEPGTWTITGAVYSLAAGAVGAVGALGIILALGYGGQTVYVMPLVFGFAPVVNTLVTAMLSRTFNQIRPIFVVGIITAAVGAGGVLVFKPTPKPAASAPETTTASGNETPASGNETPAPGNETTATGTETTGTEAGLADPVAGSEASDSDQTSPAESSESGGDAPAAEAGEATESEDAAAGEAAAGEAAAGEAVPGDSASLKSSVADVSAGRFVAYSPAAASDAASSAASSSAGAVATPARKLNVPGVVISIIMAALCWGSYGPMLHIGQGKMGGSRLRPFVCVGLAYFFIAVAAPLVLIYSRTEDAGAWTANGMTWSILAGCAGAIGALGVILAFNAGGKPYYVMPLIFGFAPVINTFISLTEGGTWGQVNIAFWISLAVVITGAVIVLTNAPKPKPHAAPAKKG